MKENSNVRLAVTGSSGFIARGVLEGCVAAGISCRAISRSTRPHWAGQAIEWSTVASYSDAAMLGRTLAGAKYVLHLADKSARADDRDQADSLRNCATLIEAMRRNSVKGAIVASSVYARLNRGEQKTSYGAVKRMIEDRFLSAANLTTIVLRLPPVYGPGGKGGLATLARLVRQGVPLPLAAAAAPRAYLSRRNLVSLVIAMVNASDNSWKISANGIFEPWDGTVINTRDVVSAMASHMGISPRLWPFPPSLLRMAAAAAGKRELVSGAIDRLDVAPLEELETAFGWRPVEHMPESLAFLRDEVSYF